MRTPTKNYSSSITKSLASTCVPAGAWIFFTLLSRSAWIPVSIFIASIVQRISPAFTEPPSATTTEEITPGIGAPIWQGLSLSAWARCCVVAWAERLTTRSVRGCPFSSKNTRVLPSSSVSPTAIRLDFQPLAWVNLCRYFFARMHAIKIGISRQGAHWTINIMGGVIG